MWSTHGNKQPSEDWWITTAVIQSNVLDFPLKSIKLGFWGQWHDQNGTPFNHFHSLHLPMAKSIYLYTMEQVRKRGNEGWFQETSQTPKEHWTQGKSVLWVQKESRCLQKPFWGIWWRRQHEVNPLSSLQNSLGSIHTCLVWPLWQISYTNTGGSQDR